MNGKQVLYIDQYGERIWAHTVKELRKKAGSGRVFKIYRDRGEKTIHVGYGVGQRWFSAFVPLEVVL